MTKGQRAMAAWLTATVLPGNTTTVAVAGAVHVSQPLMAQAKVVAEVTPAVVPAVLGSRTGRCG